MPSSEPSLLFVFDQGLATLAMALEFQLGADIVATSSSPTGAHLVQLGVVAVIRTLLNAFLARDLEAEASHRSLSPEGRP